MDNISEKVKKENIDCFLPYEEELKCHSLILLDIFNFEDFDNLINGLNRLYANSDIVDSSRLKEAENYIKSEDKLFKFWFLHLPLITNSLLKVKLPLGISHDLGNYINNINITLYGILPSMVILQVQLDLNYTFSDKINDILYNFHNETINTIETSKINYTERISPKHHKELEIKNLRISIKTEIIKFLSEYFTGYFFRLYKDNPSIIPSVELFSLTYPIGDNDVLEWGRNLKDFFSCFSTSISHDNSFKHSRYLLCRENYLETQFSNYLIFANRNFPECPEYSDFDHSIEYNIKNCSFELLAINRFISIQKRLVEKLNKMISKEIRYLQKNKLNKAIENRKSLNSELFYFERFKIEFKQYEKREVYLNRRDFIVLNGKKDFFNNLAKIIDFKMDEIGNSIKTLNKYSNSVLKLNNMKYTKKNQDSVLLLTIAVIFLTVVQIVIALTKS